MWGMTFNIWGMMMPSQSELSANEELMTDRPPLLKAVTLFPRPLSVKPENQSQNHSGDESSYVSPVGDAA